MSVWTDKPVKRIGVLLVVIAIVDIIAAVLVLAFDMNYASDMWHFVQRVWTWEWDSYYDHSFAGYSLRYAPISLIIGLLLSVWYERTLGRMYRWVRFG